MESDFRHLLEKYLDRTFIFQKENLGFTIYADAEATCIVIREIAAELDISSEDAEHVARAANALYTLPKI